MRKYLCEPIVLALSGNHCRRLVVLVRGASFHLAVEHQNQCKIDAALARTNVQTRLSRLIRKQANKNWVQLRGSQVETHCVDVGDVSALQKQSLNGWKAFVFERVHDPVHAAL